MFIKLTNSYPPADGSRNYHMINTNHIRSISVVPESGGGNDPITKEPLPIVPAQTEVHVGSLVHPYFVEETPEEILALIDREHVRLACLWINTQIEKIEQGVPA